MPQNTALVDAARRAKDWLARAALPYWADTGLDGKGRGFLEAVSLDGTPLPARAKRVRVQARQIYVMSHAWLLGWRGPALDAAERGFGFLTQKAWHPEGGFVHLLSPDGDVCDAKRDTYDHAFILLALAWYYRASRRAEVLSWIDRTLDIVERLFWEPRTDSFREGDPDGLPRRQNPHMHMLEAMLALDECVGEHRARLRAARLIELFRTVFFNRETGTLTEFFDENWRPLPDARGRIVEPGHHCEWVWLLKAYEKRFGLDLSFERHALLSFARTHGREPVTGLLLDEVRDDGQVLKATMRCWPQTEALKAAIVLEEEKAAGLSADTVLCADLLFKHYLGGVPAGLWQDQVDAAGRRLAKDVPASTLYHVFLAFAELLRIAKLDLSP